MRSFAQALALEHRTLSQQSDVALHAPHTVRKSGDSLKQAQEVASRNNDFNYQAGLLCKVAKILVPAKLDKIITDIPCQSFCGRKKVGRPGDDQQELHGHDQAIVSKVHPFPCSISTADVGVELRTTIREATYIDWFIYRLQPLVNLERPNMLCDSCGHCC